MFLQCFLISIACFFTNIGFEFFVFNALFNVFFIFIFKSEIISCSKLIVKEIQNISSQSKFLLLIILISSCYKCSLKPFLIDNESYYIQTIKWINEYGFVKGLANLHVFLAQTSPFHVLQAGFNFSFLNDNFNDINGFVLVIASIFFIVKSEEYYKMNNKFHWLNFVLIFNVLFFQFINQPSPDFVLIVLSQIIFYLFIEKNQYSDAKKVAIILFLFMFFVKITIVPIGLLIFIWVIKSKKQLILYFGSGFVIFLVLFFKNAIISGFPCYPFNFLSINVDWKLPQNIFDFLSVTKNSGYFENKVILNPSFYQKILGWLQLSGMNRFFNLGMILLFGIALFFKKIRSDKNYLSLYIVLLIHFIILIFISPQFRFFLPEFVFFTVLIISNIFNYLKFNFKIVQILLIIFITFSSIFIEFIDFKKLTSNTLLHSHNYFQIKNLLVPEPNSKYDYLKFEKIKNGNLEYYSPTENFFFFGTANGELPCVNKVQIEYLEKYYFVKPQMRTNKLKDGFYCKIIKK